MSIEVAADFVGGVPTPVQPSLGKLMEIGAGEKHPDLFSPRRSETESTKDCLAKFQNSQTQPPPPPPAVETVISLNDTNVAAEARKSIADEEGKARNRGIAKPPIFGMVAVTNGPRGGVAYTEKSGYLIGSSGGLATNGESESPANGLILGVTDTVSRDKLSRPSAVADKSADKSASAVADKSDTASADGAVAIADDPLVRWIATGDSILAYLQPKKVFSVVSMGDKRRSKAISMVTHAQIALCDPGLYDVHSNSYVGIDENGGYMKEKCIPFHLLAVTCMLKGKKTGGTMLGKIEEVWEEIKTIATTDNGDFQLSNAFLETPLVNHAKKAYIKYHSIVFVSDTPHICAKRGGILLNWIMELKDDVRTNKERIEKERWGTILAEATNTATMAQAEPHSGGDEEPEVSFQ